MQVIYKNKDKRSSSGGIDTVDTVICIRRVSRCLEEHVGGFGKRVIGI